MGIEEQNKITKGSNHIQPRRLKNINIPESSVAVELNVDAHEDKGGEGENSLSQAQSQAGASPERPWQFVHVICSVSVSVSGVHTLFAVMAFQSQISTSESCQNCPIYGNDMGR